MDPLKFVSYETFMHGKREIDKSLPRIPRAKSIASKTLWNDYVQRGLVTSMKEQLGQLRTKLDEHETEVKLQYKIAKNSPRYHVRGELKPVEYWIERSGRTRCLKSLMKLKTKKINQGYL